MKTTYPKYKQGEISIIESKLNKKDKDILKNFLIYCGATAGQAKLRLVRTKMLQIRDVSQVPYDKWDLDVLRQFLSVLNKSDLAKATKNEVKKCLKRFLKEYYHDWNQRFKGLQDIKGENDVNPNKVNANTILTAEDLEKIIRAAETLKFKALIMLMFESGGRPNEILSLKWKDINLEKEEVKLFSSKNGTVRINPIKESVIHLKRYKQEYPFPNVQSEDYVFPAPSERKKQFSVNYFSMVFNRLTEKAIGRRIFPYILRHTRATQLQKVLPPKVYEKFMDHSIETATRYSHLDKNDVREVMMEKIYHIEELTEGDKQQVKELKDELEKVKTNNSLLADKVQNAAEESNQNYRLLKELSIIVKIMTKAALRDKNTETYFKKQLNKVFPKGTSIYSIQEECSW